MNQIIHAAVRRDLARTAQALRAVSDGDASRVQGVHRAWSYLVRELEHHHEGEDAHLWPYLRGRGVDGGLLDTMESEHHDMHVALDAGTAAIDAAVEEPTAERAGEAADVVDRTAAVVVGHLDHEEREVESVLRQHRSTDEFKSLEKKFRHQGLTAAGDFLAWVQDGASERELTSLKQTIPAPVVVAVTAIFGRGYRRDVAPVWKV
jgi:hemerythrin-like domain-containing protein